MSSISIDGSIDVKKFNRNTGPITRLNQSEGIAFRVSPKKNQNNAIDDDMDPLS